MKTFRGWIIVAALAGVLGFGFARQAVTLSEMRTHLDVRRLDLKALDELRRENTRLAALPPDTEQADESAMAKARAELLDLQRRAGQPRSASSAPVSDHLAVGMKCPGTEWKNAGTATPQATLETVLWAAVGGDIDTFGASIVLPESGARKAAQTLFDGLPAEERERYRTPERLIAALSIPDIPTGAVEVQGWSDAASEGPTRFVGATFSAPDGTAKKVTLMFVHRDDGWKLGVTRATVAKYAAQLKRADPAATR